MGFIWTIIIGFWRALSQSHFSRAQRTFGFILTTILGIVGAFVATFLGQALGWYRAGEGAGFIGAVVGAIILLAIWGAVTRSQSRV
jgi:uncharacterized membrane protein YeaQ/YmgE (transglycosylase-associated protein family)